MTLNRLVRLVWDNDSSRWWGFFGVFLLFFRYSLPELPSFFASVFDKEISTVAVALYLDQSLSY